MIKMPWHDCKVAFDIENIDKFRRWLDKTEDGKGFLPEGWSFNEWDCSGARCVVVFRVESPLREVDGKTVRRLLNRIDRRK